MLKKYLVFLVLLAQPCLANAKITEQTEVSEGYGPTREMALRDALSKAVGQATGIKIATDSKIITSQVQSEVEVGSDRVSGSAIAVTQSDASSLKTQGNIKSYKIINSKKDDDGLYIVKVSAIIYKFQADASSNRKRIALMPTKLHQGRYELYKMYPAAQVQDLVENAVERYLVQSRKFAVLSRSDLKALGAEMALISSDATPASEKARLGQLLGSDFILLPELVSGEAQYTEKRIQVTGQVKSWFSGDISILMRVIATATGEIKFSEKYSVPANDFRNAEDALAFVASIGVSDLVQRIYPNRIVSVSGGEVVINSGGNSLQPGMRLNVFAEGERLVDPYTGESLGAREVQVGEVVISQVDQKMAYAKIVSGDQIAQGHIVRENLSVPETAQPKPVEKNQGGFKAPWE